MYGNLFLVQGELGSTRTINVVLEGFFPNRPDDSLNEEELNRIPLVLISQKHLGMYGYYFIILLLVIIS